MRVLVIGGTGSMGQGVARDLIKQRQIAAVILGDKNTALNRLQQKLQTSDKISLAKIDVNNHNSMVDAIKKVDVVINCAGPFYKTAVAVAKAAVEAKVNYIDICDDYEATEILFASNIDKAAKDADIIVLTGMGSDPGTNNVLVKWYADKLENTTVSRWKARIRGRRYRRGNREVSGTARRMCCQLCRPPSAINHTEVHSRC